MLLWFVHQSDRQLVHMEFTTFVNGHVCVNLYNERSTNKGSAYRLRLSFSVDHVGVTTEKNDRRQYAIPRLVGPQPGKVHVCLCRSRFLQWFLGLINFYCCFSWRNSDPPAQRLLMN